MGTLGDNLEFIYGDLMKGLPPGYRRVEYLESTGEQWIDTGVVPDFGTEVQIYSGFTSYVQGTQLCGSRTGNANNNRYFVSAVLNSTKIRFVMNFSTIEVAYSYDGRLHHIVYNQTGTHNVYYDDALIATFAAGNTVDIQNTLYLFGTSGYEGNNWCGVGKNAECKIIHDVILVRDFVPCVRTSDSKPGMYDLCGSICGLTNSPFYVNAGTGADFLWGELS